MMKSELAALRAAFITEVQAVAIYQSECWILTRTSWTGARALTLRVCRRTLREELEHQNWMAERVGSGAILRISVMLNHIAGISLGAFLSLLPSRLSWWVHAWAEGQAASAYEAALTVLSARPEAVSFLKKSAAQELGHQMRFAKLHRRIRVFASAR